jgi:hypothetical protein
VTLYRPMKADLKGLPMIGRKRWGLGIRISGPYRDVTPVKGMVAPLGGGMSVARDWHDMQPGFVPLDLGGTNPRDEMFSLAEEDLPPELHLRQSGPRKGHFVIEPRRTMPIGDYEVLLAGTQALWKMVRP